MLTVEYLGLMSIPILGSKNIPIPGHIHTDNTYTDTHNNISDRPILAKFISAWASSHTQFDFGVC